MSKKNKQAYVIGYSIDSCIFARMLSNEGIKVTHFNTGVLGGVMDLVNEFLDEASANTLNSMLADKAVDFTKRVNYRYAYIPYEDLQFVNNRNGVFSYPINKGSFETAQEIDELNACTHNLKSFTETISKANNYINIYKSFFPKWLYDTIFKYIGINKWGVRQSKLTREGLLAEINIDYMDGFGNGIVYQPTVSYKNICEVLLNTPNITRKELNIKECRPMMTQRFPNIDFYFMDNRVDIVVGYHFGQLDRVEICVDRVSDTNLVEFIDLDNAIVITPTNQSYWCVVNNYGDIRKIRSNPSIAPTEYTMSELAPTINNQKSILEYESLLNLYSGKKLHLKKYINGIIV